MAVKLQMFGLKHVTFSETRLCGSQKQQTKTTFMAHKLYIELYIDFK